MRVPTDVLKRYHSGSTWNPHTRGAAKGSTKAKGKVKRKLLRPPIGGWK